VVMTVRGGGGCERWQPVGEAEASETGLPKAGDIWRVTAEMPHLKSVFCFVCVAKLIGM
jgi:hypothetical protein